MLNKELLMMGGTKAKEMWTLRLNFTGNSSIDIMLWDSTDMVDILWRGNPNAGIVTIQIPAKSTLLLTTSGWIYKVITEDGCVAEDYAIGEMTITVYQNDAYLEMNFKS